MQDHDQAQSEPRREEPNKPIETLRDGNLKASIWRNEGENGPTYSTTFARTWRDGKGQYRDSQSYAGTDLLRLQELTRSAYHRTNELRRDQAVEQRQDQSRSDAERDAFREKRGAQSAAPERKQSR